LKSKNFD